MRGTLRQQELNPQLHMHFDDNCFTLLRLLCCLIIIYEHCVRICKLLYLDLHLSELCVAVFFILSGFWVTRSYQQADSLYSYIKKRVIKILPPYLFVVVGCVIVGGIISEYGLKNYWFLHTAGIIKYVLCNMFFLNFLCPSLPGVFFTSGIEAINGSLWTMKIEVGFYVILPSIIRLMSHINNNLVLIVVYFLSIGWSVLLSTLGVSQTIVEQLPFYMSFFAVGMFFSLNAKIIKRIKMSFVIIALILLIISRIIKPLDVVIMPIALGVIIIYIGFSVRVKFPDYSYFLYLVHFPIIQLINNYCDYKSLYIGVSLVVSAMLAIIWEMIWGRVVVKNRIKECDAGKRI